MERGEGIAKGPRPEVRVLLVEDNAGDARLLEFELADTSTKFRITRAARLDAGIVHLATGAFDVVLLDLHLPDSQGIETFRRASQAAKDTPIVVLSGLSDEGVGVEAVQAGAQDYLVKGQTSPGILERTIRYAVERSQAASQLRHDISFLSAITGSLGEGILAVDTGARITFVNPSAERLLGWRRAQLIGRPIGDVLSAPRDGGKSAADQSLLEALRTGRPVQRDDAELPRRNGSRFAAASTASPILEDGKITGAVLAFRDVTAQREIDRVKREFVSTVSHELRTPLTSIRGSLGLLAGGMLGELTPQAREIVAVATRNVIRLGTLINDILDFERLEDGRMEIQSVPVPIEVVIARSLESVQPFADQEGVTLRAAGVAGVALGDVDRLVQVFVNLLSNAVKFSPRGSEVTIESVPRSDGLELRVIDHGRGIPASFHEKIFERFQQVDSSDTRRNGGTGLGLAISKLIVEKHRGTIGVESEEGRGSTFWIRLPVAASGTEAEKASVDSPIQCIWPAGLPGISEGDVGSDPYPSAGVRQ